MTIALESLPAAAIDRVEPLWRQLLRHHQQVAGHLAELGTVRPSAESWRLRRAQYRDWLREPATIVLVAPDGDGIAGYAVGRVVDAPGSWQWGDRVGVLETLVVDDRRRGSGVGQALFDRVRAHLAEQGAAVLRISVIAGNDGAARFYRRAGAVSYTETLIMPI